VTRADLTRIVRLGATPETRRAAAEALHALDALEIRLALDAAARATSAGAPTRWLPPSALRPRPPSRCRRFNG
jgi:hypothetical protein